VADPAPTRLPGAIRATRQAAAVRDALAGRPGFTSAQDLHADLRRRGGGVGLTTVYRHLQSLADAGAVDVLRTPDGESVYRICGTGGHHHHLVCRSCGRTVEISGREVERWTSRVAEAEGFVDIDHTIEIFGTCAGCHSGGVPRNRRAAGDR
jgi:Fur family transcriptional regulator, ferric uptake regulator